MKPANHSLGIKLLTSWTNILRLAECKNKQEYRRQEQQTEAKAYALAKRLRQSEIKDNGVDKVDNRNDEKKELPTVSVDDLAVGVEIVERNQCLPSTLTSLAEDKPHGDQHEHRDNNR